MVLRSGLLYLVLLAALSLPTLLPADAAVFDLPGPRVEVRVSRAGRELPIAEVPNLQEGDRLWVHPAFPETQSAHYLLIVAFLRGTTNPPPESWFTKIETWKKRVRSEGVMVTVPKGAQQVLMFLAPETGGDFSTLRSNVRGRPGAFVRAAMDLNRAALDRSRSNAYLNAVKNASSSDPEQLKAETTLLARSLNIKLADDCFTKPPDEQASCLTQNSDQLTLDDPHSQSLVAELANGPSADIASQMSVTPWAGAGYYSPYVGAVVDVVKLMTSFHTAEYQYIPALATPAADQLNLQLNTAPSFEKPKSVLVIGLPAVEPPQLPPLRAVDSKGVYCLQNSSLVLPVEGAPLVFSTSLAHDFMLHVRSKSGASLDIPVRADAVRGGFVIDDNPRRTTDWDSAQPSAPHAADFAKLGPSATGTLRGQWGFEPFEGPTFALRTSQPAKWTVPSADQSALIVGREDTLQIQSDAAVCVDEVSVRDQQGKELKSSYKILGADKLQVAVSLKDATPGPLTMRLKQFGLAQADTITLQSYSQAGHLESFSFDAGDHQGVLQGTRLDKVASLEMGGIRFAPDGLTRAGDLDKLQMSSPAAADVSGLTPGSQQTAHVLLKDGRLLDLPTTVQPPRPRLTLMSKMIQPDAAAPSPIQLASQDELPQQAQLSFSLKTQVPGTFPLDEKIEVATNDGSLRAFLTVANGKLMLQDAQTVLAVFDPMKDLGPSAFGPLRFRPVSANGETGDWQPLAILVRLPQLQNLRCPEDATQPCTLQGTGLYLLDAIASDPQFQQSTPVPDGFAGSTLNVPHPSGQDLYVKLRDDPSAVNMLNLLLLPDKAALNGQQSAAKPAMPANSTPSPMPEH